MCGDYRLNQMFNMFTFQIVTLSLLVLSALGLTPPYYDLANAEELFAEFIKKHDRNYESNEEFTKRFEAFKRSLKKINEFNDHFKYDDGGYFINQFSDVYEKKPCYRASRLPNATQKVKNVFLFNAPDSIDYRDQNLVSPVKNQGSDCSDCFVFAAIETIEGVYAKQTGTLYSLSEQQGLDCAGNCDGGSPVNCITKMVDQGCMTEEDYPYTGKLGQCGTVASKVKVKVTGENTLSTPDVESLKGALVQNGAPIAIGMYASDQIKTHNGPNILTPTDCAGHDADHAVLLVGYNTDPASGKKFWIIKNSWGTDAGDKGYFYLDFQSTADCQIGVDGAATATVA